MHRVAQLVRDAAGFQPWQAGSRACTLNMQKTGTFASKQPSISVLMVCLPTENVKTGHHHLCGLVDWPKGRPRREEAPLGACVTLRKLLSLCSFIFPLV